ncbi:MAG: hypothetical protein M3R24_25420, partial [Chloroflexota bacterium]|nr:hypothetical protein [Chloroflexota bacterium]
MTSSTADRVVEELAPFKLKQVDDRTYRCNNPWRPGSNSQAFTLTIDCDGEHGAYFDHVSHEKGSLYDLAARLGVDPPSLSRQADVPTTKRAYSSGVEYAEAHGAPWAAFEQLEWHECSHNHRPALAIPTDTGTRYRYLDGEPQAFHSPRGYERCWYGLRAAIELAASTKQPLVYCNGEASTAVALWHKVAACTVTGGGENKIPASLLVELRKRWDGEIIVALDCDKVGRKAAHQIVAQLHDVGFVAHAVDLAGYDKYDLADHCKLYGAESAAALAALPDTNPRSELYYSSLHITLSLELRWAGLLGRLRTCPLTMSTP